MRSAHVSHEVDFDVTPSLKERMAHWDELEEGLEDDLFSLSPLTSPESSPTATPTLKTAELPAEIPDLSQAIEPLPSAAQERLKRRRLLQGRNNRAKRQRSGKGMVHLFEPTPTKNMPPILFLISHPCLLRSPRSPVLATSM